MGVNFEQLSRPAGSFGQQQLWGAAFRSFGATALENSFGHNFVEQRRGTALGSSFEEQLCTAALKNRSFGEHHWGQLWGAAFGSRFGGNRFAEVLWRTAFGSWGATTCGEQRCGIAAALTDSCFEERQLWGVALKSNF